jgi:type IV secretion system protein VirB5
MNKNKKSPASPYLDGRQEWEERYGSFVSSAKSWKITAFLSLSIALVSTVGAIYLASQKEVVPYIVEIDKTGLVQQTQRANTTDKATEDRIITAQLALFVEKVRNVVLDVRLQRKNVMDSYVYLQKNTPAFTKITEYFRKNDPFERARKETVFVEILRILPLKDKAYQVEWRETVMDRQTGQTNNTYNYKLVAYITLSPPDDEAAILKNPIGLIINDLNWSKEI